MNPIKVYRIASLMVYLFEKNSGMLDEEKALTRAGFQFIQTVFDLVPEAYRAAVFVMFLAELDRKGIEYDKDAFISDDDEGMDADAWADATGVGGDEYV